MQVVLFGRTRVIRVRSVLAWSCALVVLTGVLAFCVYFTRAFIAIRRGDVSGWQQQKLESSVSRALANPQTSTVDARILVRTNRPSLGPANAPLTVVAFLDYQCPFCERSAPAWRETMLKYQDRVRFIVRDFPLEEIHPTAFASAHAARCAFAQQANKGWAFHDALYAHREQQSSEELERYAAQAGLDMNLFRSCTTSQTHASSLREDLADGVRAGVQGTPTYFFNGVRIQGVPADRSTEFFDFLVERFLREATSSTTRTL